MAFTLRRSKRRTLGITIKPDGSVLVAAPLQAPLARIEALVAAKSDWIAKKQHEIATLRPPSPPKTYTAGERHRHLGRDYALSPQTGARESVTLNDNQLIITTPTPDDRDRLRVLLRRWRRTEAARVLQERFDAHLPLVDKLGYPRPHLVLRDMRRSWGNCRPATGRITLNRDVIRAPQDCIDYVIVHEICHLPHPNHSKAFYALMDALQPDWRSRKAVLERALA